MDCLTLFTFLSIEHWLGQHLHRRTTLYTRTGLASKLQNRAEELHVEILHREKMEQEIFRLQSLNLIGEMAAGMALEIRNPLTSVRGYLQYYGMKSNLTEYKEQFSLLIDELDRANGIITDFLALSKNKAIDLKALNINTEINTTLPLMHTTALMYNHRIITDLRDVPEILADEKELRQCLLNFATNGLEAMSNSGTLLISAFLDSKNRIALCIRDEGHGIPERIRGKIGTSFFTTKSNGTGLGLAVCYSISARQKAVIDFETSDTGTSFYMRFNPLLISS